MVQLTFSFSSLGESTVTDNSRDLPELREFEVMALSLMEEHGVSDWSLEFDTARQRAGLCNYETRTLSFSSALMALWTREQRRDVVLHEIAHALAPGDGHGSEWKQACTRIGANPNRTWGHNNEQSLARYTGTCPGNHPHERDRKPRGPVSCSLCCPRFSADYLIAWTEK